VLVLVSFGLVLLATILLVVGLLTDDGLNLIYLSIACSAGAAVVLWLAFRRAKPTQERAAQPPAPILPDGVEPGELDAPADDATTVQPALPEPDADDAATVNPGGTPTADTEPAIGTAEPVEEPAAVGAVDDDWVADDDWAESGDFDVEFPIADYDELTVDEIMPLLPQLYSDELDVVAERERSTKGRAEILDRLAELATTGTEADALDGADLPAVDGEAAAAAVNPGGTPTADTDPAVATAPARAARPAPQVPSLADDEWEEGEVPFPIADYDELTADQVIALLPQLEEDELEDVKAREVATQGRKSVITEIDRLLGVESSPDDWRADEPAAPAPTPAASLDDATAGQASLDEATADEAATAEGRDAPTVASPEGSLLAIAGYDALTVAQIRPLLAGLSHAELRAVLDHEVARDNRRTVVSDIERRLAQPEGVGAPAEAPAPPARKAAATRATTRKAPATGAPARKAAARKAATPAAPARKAAKKAAAGRFPIARYDELSVSEIRPRLAGLSARQLQQVRDREVAGAARRTLLAEIDRRLAR